MYGDDELLNNGEAVEKGVEWGQIVSQKFEFPIVIYTIIHRDRRTPPVSPNKDGVWIESKDEEDSEMEISKLELKRRLFERGDLEGGAVTIQDIVSHWFDRIMDDGEMGFSDFVIMEKILSHYLTEMNNDRHIDSHIEDILKHYFYSKELSFEAVNEIVEDCHHIETLAHLIHLVPDNWVQEINNILH